MGRGVDEQCLLLDGLRCVWIGVPDLPVAAQIFEDALGFRRTAEGTTLPAMAGPGVLPSPWIHWTAPGERSGAICVFADRARPPREGLPRGWDCVEAVVADVDASADALASVPGVVAVHAPFTTDLSDEGSNVHRSAVWRMPWGTHLILTAGMTVPAEREFPTAPGRVGRVFEVHLRTDDFPAARRFYADVLGMPSLIDVLHTFGPMHEAWSLPQGHLVQMSFLKTGGPGTGRGAVELQGHPRSALQPRDGSGAGLPGGTAMLTCTTSRLDAAHAAVTAAQFPATTPRRIEHGPMAGHRAVLVRGTEGELLQLVEE